MSKQTRHRQDDPPPWDGVMRQQAVLTAIIEWGPVAGYGKLTRCGWCFRADAAMARHTRYLNIGEELTHWRPADGAWPDEAEEHAAVDARLTAVTRQQCTGQFTRTVGRPLCVACATALVRRFLHTTGNVPPVRHPVLTQRDGYSALLLCAVPGVDGTIWTMAATGAGEPDPLELVRRVAGLPADVNARAEQHVVDLDDTRRPEWN
jgi:hypothetical protein